MNETFNEVTNEYGHNIIMYPEIKLGTCDVSEHYNQWLNVWHEMQKPPVKERCKNRKKHRHNKVYSRRKK